MEAQIRRSMYLQLEVLGSLASDVGLGGVSTGLGLMENRRDKDDGYYRLSTLL